MDTTEAAVAQAAAKLIDDHGIAVHQMEGGMIQLTSLGGHGYFLLTPAQWVLIKVVVDYQITKDAK